MKTTKDPWDLHFMGPSGPWAESLVRQTASAKLHSNHFIKTWMKAEWNIHWIWNMMEKSFMKWASGMLPRACCTKEHTCTSKTQLKLKSPKISLAQNLFITRLSLNFAQSTAAILCTKWRLGWENEIVKQHHMVVEYFLCYFTRHSAWKPWPRKGSGFHAGSPSEVTRKIFNCKCGFVFIPHLCP